MVQAMCKVINFEEALRVKKQIVVENLFDEIPTKYITGVAMVNHNGDPAVLIQARGKEYIWKIVNGFRIHMMNEILRALNLGIEIEFYTFMQYGTLLLYADEIIKNRNAAGSIISL
jgi:hypothetical protein